MDLTAPFVKTGVISETVNLALAVPIGFLFGFGLFHAGFGGQHAGVFNIRVFFGSGQIFPGNFEFAFRHLIGGPVSIILLPGDFRFFH